MTKTAGIIIIGNEILSGKVHDVNSYYLASELRSLGVDLRRISVIPDDVEVIGKEAVEFSRSYDYVFTSGGVGPTHDDVTMAGIAMGFGEELVSHDEIRAVLESRYDVRFNSAVLKMTEVPRSAEVFFKEGMRFPIVSYKNIFIFPGIPEYVRTKFDIIRERFRSSVYYIRRLYLNSHESQIAEMLNEVVTENKDVTFGSYPILGRDDYRVIVTAEAKSEDVLINAVSVLMKRLPDNILVRVE